MVSNLMILLTKLNDRKVLVGMETVKFLESIPDTMIAFTNGETLIVKESLEEISKAVLNYEAEVARRAARDS